MVRTRSLHVLFHPETKVAQNGVRTRTLITGARVKERSDATSPSETGAKSGGSTSGGSQPGSGSGSQSGGSGSDFY